MIKINMSYSILQKNSPAFITAFLFLAFIFFYQISPQALKDFDRICSSNYGHAAEYRKCMVPFWSLSGFYNAGLIVSSILAGVFVVIFIIQARKQKRA